MKRTNAGNRTAFISHRCLDEDHRLVAVLRQELEGARIRTIVDPFVGGDRTCLAAQKAIKESTHFVLLATASSCGPAQSDMAFQEPASRWVAIESLCAGHCAVRGGVVLIGVKASDAHLPEILQQFIHLPFAADVSDVVERLKSAILSTFPEKRLLIHTEESKRFVEEGREAERRQARSAAARPGATYHDCEDLHRAVALYDRAIELDFCNHHAWLNKGWSLWKLRSESGAWKCVNTARLLRPDSDRVQEIIGRMQGGHRALW